MSSRVSRGARRALIARLAEPTTAVVRALVLCGGPATGGTWVEDGSVYRALLSELRPAEPRNPYGATHVHGLVSVRMATEAELAALERAEASGRDPRPYRLWQGRPHPNVPRYHRGRLANAPA